MADTEMKIILKIDERHIVRVDNDNMVVNIIKTNEGYIIDVYNCEENHINSLTVWQDDLNESEEDNNPYANY